jgi:23S rRNA (cytidine1920-2'-O)/16S rRNA (cytidine1409-2'-O)-methyltransferase
MYVSRAGLKLASVADKFRVNFKGTIVLDVGSSTGGFTDYALQHGAKFVYAVDVGTEQLHPSLRGHRDIELHEKTDIRGFRPSKTPDIIVIDVSFVSLRDILPSVAAMAGPTTIILAMVKPQFEASRHQIGSSGVIKNDNARREILKEFEAWAKQSFVIKDKADSDVRGTKGNLERFYVLTTVKR